MVADEIQSEAPNRRIDLHSAPTEIAALAASFDAMLDRLHDSAQLQRRLIEEISHELRTPLAVLTTNADVLPAHPDPTLDTYRQGIERSKAAARWLRIIVEELLVDARGRARVLDSQATDLTALVGRVVDVIRPLADDRDITIEFLGAESLTGAVDPATIERAVTNLVDNAVRYSRPGSVVEVETTSAGSVSGQDLVITVTDHGPGVPAEEQDRIFDRYWRRRDDHTGSGLGLPIAQQIARAHGGDISLVSPGASGDGSPFTLRLPAGAGPVEPRLSTPDQ